MKALFVAKTPAPVSVEAGHYFQGAQGTMFWNRLKKYGLLSPQTEFEDDSLLDHGYGLTDIVKVPRAFGNEPSTAEYSAGIDRILAVVADHQPIIVVFVYKGVLDEVIRQRFGIRRKSEYGFNPSLAKHFGARVFAFPLPGTPCKAAAADIAMLELAAALGNDQMSVAASAPAASPSPSHGLEKDREKGGNELRSTSEMTQLIVRRFKAQGHAQVRGYNSFGFVEDLGAAIVVSRETGKDTRFPIRKIEDGVSAVRSDASVYDGGPGRLCEHGITHVNSVVWALLHLATKSELLE